MKNILFATTALVATAGAASAEIDLTGWAEMGIVGGDVYGETTQFHTDIDVTFTMSGEADNGLTFGANVDLDENGAFGSTTQGGEVIFVAYGNAKLSMGDVDGAYDAAMQEVAIAGTIDDLNTTHGGFNANSGMDGSYDGQIAQFEYSFNSFTAYLSAELDDIGDYDPVWGVGVRYTASLAGLDLGVGIGYQSGDQDYADDGVVAAVDSAFGGADGSFFDDPATIADETADNAAVMFATAEDFADFADAISRRSDVWGISLDTTFNNGIMARVNYSQANYSDVAGWNDETETHWGLGLGYTMNALTVAANFGKYNDYLGIDELESKGWSLAANYDLGGGLQAQAGYSQSEVSAPGDSFDYDQFSLGLRMDF